MSQEIYLNVIGLERTKKEPSILHNDDSDDVFIDRKVYVQKKSIYASADLEPPKMLKMDGISTRTQSLFDNFERDKVPSQKTESGVQNVHKPVARTTNKPPVLPTVNTNQQSAVGIDYTKPNKTFPQGQDLVKQKEPRFPDNARLNKLVGHKSTRPSEHQIQEQRSTRPTEPELPEVPRSTRPKEPRLTEKNREIGQWLDGQQYAMQEEPQFNVQISTRQREPSPEMPKSLRPKEPQSTENDIISSKEPKFNLQVSTKPKESLSQEQSFTRPKEPLPGVQTSSKPIEPSTQEQISTMSKEPQSQEQIFTMPKKPQSSVADMTRSKGPQHDRYNSSRPELKSTRPIESQIQEPKYVLANEHVTEAKTSDKPAIVNVTSKTINEIEHFVLHPDFKRPSRDTNEDDSIKKLRVENETKNKDEHIKPLLVEDTEDVIELMTFTPLESGNDSYLDFDQLEEALTIVDIPTVGSSCWQENLVFEQNSEIQTTGVVEDVPTEDSFLSIECGPSIDLSSPVEDISFCSFTRDPTDAAAVVDTVKYPYLTKEWDDKLIEIKRKYREALLEADCRRREVRIERNLGIGEWRSIN